MIDFEVNETEDTKRFVALDNGNKIHVQRTDPYGLWTVHYDKGQVPQSLQGSYTSFDIAMGAVTSYLATKKIAVAVKDKEKEKEATKKNGQERSELRRE